MAKKSKETPLILNERFFERLFDSLFKVEDLPDTMDINFINWTLNRYGYITLLRADDGTRRSLQGAISGVDVYNRPMFFESVNPVSQYSGLRRMIDVDCIVLRNTLNNRFTRPIMPIIEKYAIQLTEIEKSIMCAIYNSRVSSVFNAHDDAERQKIAAAFDKVAEGNPFIITNALTPAEQLRGASSRPLIEQLNNSRNSYVLDLLLRDRWTIICNFLTEIGVNNNPFEKAERQITDEVNSNNDLLYIANFEFLEARRVGWEKFNEMFGENVKISFNPDYARQILADKKETIAKNSPEEGEADV